VDEFSDKFDDKFDDEHYPAYTMGRAADMLGVTPGFLRNLDEHGLLDPQRSAGGHRRYSRHQLRLAARVRELVDQGTALAAACRIVTLEDQLVEARRAHARAVDADTLHTGARDSRAPTRRRRSTNDDADHAPATG
jgi:DNA-binding transcriptional MerR regulator